MPHALTPPAHRAATASLRTHKHMQMRRLLRLTHLPRATPCLFVCLDRQVMMTSGKALDIAADEAQRSCYWLVLSKQRSTDIVGGELCLGFEVTPMEPQQFNQVRVCITLLC